MNSPSLWFSLAAALPASLCACAATSEESARAGSVAAGATAVSAAPDAPSAVRGEVIPAPKPMPSGPQIVDQALGLLRRGKDHYRQGEYRQAEKKLKQAMALYPFLPEANLILGKVFLIRGSATRDRALLNGARLMFEMASAMDPKLREAVMLIELVKNTPLE